MSLEWDQPAINKENDWDLDYSNVLGSLLTQTWYIKIHKYISCKKYYKIDRIWVFFVTDKYTSFLQKPNRKKYVCQNALFLTSIVYYILYSLGYHKIKQFLYSSSILLL